jgi:hypothetical protein
LFLIIIKNKILNSFYLFMIKATQKKTIESSKANKYYLLLADKESVEWNIYSNQIANELMWTAYHNKILQTVEQNLEEKSLVFYITKDELDDLPSYGENVVVIIAGDEWCRFPKYAHRVLAIFKSYGTKPFLGCNPLLEPSYINFASLIQFLRIWISCLPRLINYRFQLLMSLILGRLRSNIYTIPLGYYNQYDTPEKNISRRTNDVFFAGSIADDTYPPGLIKRFIISLLKPPKIQSRQSMVFCIRKFQDRFLNFKVELSITSSFFTMNDEDIKAYSERLMDSKICLIPRGTSYETYRLFEAIRFGCIPIFEALPPHWFYEDSFGVKVKNWNNLEEILEELLNDSDLLQSKHQRALWWWENKCSESAVGQYIVDKLLSAGYP